MDHEQIKMEYEKKMEKLAEDTELRKAWSRIKKIKVNKIRKMLGRYGLSTKEEKSLLQERVYRFQARLIRPAADVSWIRELDEVEEVTVNAREGWLDINPKIEELLQEVQRRSGSGSATSGREALSSDQGAVGRRRSNKATAESGSKAQQDLNATTKRRLSDVRLPVTDAEAAVRAARTTMRFGIESSRATMVNGQDVPSGSKSQDETTHRPTGTRKKSLPLESSLQRVRLTDVVETQRTPSSPIESGQPTFGTKRTLVSVKPIDMTRSNALWPVMHTIIESDIESEESSGEESRPKMQKRTKRSDKRPTAKKVGGGEERCSGGSKWERMEERMNQMFKKMEELMKRTLSKETTEKNIKKSTNGLINQYELERDCRKEIVEESIVDE